MNNPPPLVPEGPHRARAIKPTSNPWGKSKEKGTDFVRLTFRIADGDFAGRSVAWDGYFTENTDERTIQSLQHCGCTFPNNDITNLEGVDANEVIVVVEHQQFDREEGPVTFARVAWVNALTRGIATELQMDQTQKASFADKMRGKLSFKKAGKPAPQAASSGFPADDFPLASDDDTPF